MNIKSLGWDLMNGIPATDENFPDCVPARIAVEQKERYLVLGDFGEASAEVSGKYRFNAVNPSDYPAVGDWVRVQVIDPHSPVIIHELMPRRNAISRHAAGIVTREQVMAANVDVAFLVVGLDSDYNPRRLERWITTLLASKTEPIILLNKSDLCPEFDTFVETTRKLSSGIAVYALSARDNRGLEQLEPHLAPQKTVVFLGSSGVGKSTLINQLLGFERQKTNDVSEFKSKGKHTTTYRELLFLPSGSIVIDTPGMREIQLWSDDSSLSAAFSDIEQFQSACRFADCSHNEEPGCAVQAAIESGELDSNRYQSYLKLQREIAHLERKQDTAAARQQSREWSKRIQQHHKAMKELRRIGLAGIKKGDRYDR